MSVLGIYHYWVFAILLMIGFYAVIAKLNLVKKLIGLSLFQAAVFLLYITMGKVVGGTAPTGRLLGESGESRACWLPSPSCCCTVQTFVLFQALRDLRAYRHHRIQGGHGFLKNHGDTATADSPHAFLGEYQEFFTIQQHGTGHDLATRPRKQSQQGQGRHGLSATRLAKQRESLALPDVKADAVYRAYCGIAMADTDAEVFYLQQGLAHRLPLFAQAGIEGIPHRIGEEVGWDVVEEHWTGDRSALEVSRALLAREQELLGDRGDDILRFAGLMDPRSDTESERWPRVAPLSD